MNTPTSKELLDHLCEAQRAIDRLRGTLSEIGPLSPDVITMDEALSRASACIMRRGVSALLALQQTINANEH